MKRETCPQDTKQYPTVEIFTDGACSGNPGPGGYGAILKFQHLSREISGGSPSTTNNRMEMKAVIEALRQLKRPCRVKIVTDSSYVVKGMTEWVHKWAKSGWLNSQKKPVKNRDLWERMLEAGGPHDISWELVKGHSGHSENERCDRLAREAVERQ